MRRAKEAKSPPWQQRHGRSKALASAALPVAGFWACSAFSSKVRRDRKQFLPWELTIVINGVL
jgi:hypothetical protein